MTQQMPAYCAACGAAAPPGARFCAQCGAGLAVPGDVAGERRQAVVLFADLCGFTALSRRLDAEDVHGLLARFFAVVDAEIRRHGGAIDKHVGDAVMGVFGAPVSHGNDAERAVRAALAMHAAVAGLPAVDGEPLRLHVGIAGGEVVAARTGSAIHSEYTVTGPAANLAARLVAQAGPGETVVGDAIVEAARRIAGVSELPTAALKGIDSPMRIWRLVGQPSPPAVDGVPLVGREGERAQLAALISAAANGKGAVVVLRGDPGIGKTRLLEEGLAIAAAAGMACIRAGALDFGLDRGGDIGRVVARALAPGATAAVAAHAAALDALLDRPRDTSSAAVWAAMTPALREDACRAALAALAAETAARTPLLIAVEDVHWADPDSLARLASLASAARDRPIAIVLTTRIDGDPLDRAWRAATGTTPLTTVDLAPLHAEDALRLALAVLPGAAAAAKAWVARADGNPLFLIELARHAVDTPTTLPDSIQSVVQARIDRLPPGDKVLIQCASVAGQRVDRGLLEALAAMPAVDCGRLVAAGLLRQEGAVLVFAHALVRDGVYATLLRARRRDLHRRAAEHLAARDPGLAAQHLDRAEDPAAAAAYAGAARAEEGRGQIAAALALARRGLAIATSPADRAALHRIAGETLLELGATAESEAAFRESLALASTDADRCRAWIGIAASLRVLSRVDDALAALDAADAARGTDATLAECAARTHHLRGNLRFARGEAAACGLEHRRTLEIARAAGLPEYEARALNGLGDSAYAAGRMATALTSFERSSALCRRHGFGRIDQSNRFMIGNCLIYQNRLAEGVAVVREAAAAAERAGSRMMRMLNSETMGLLLEEAGADAEAVAELDHALTLSHELGSRRFDAIILAARALSRARLGDRPGAERDAGDAEAIAAATGQAFVGALVLGSVALVAGDPAVAAAALERGEALLADGGVAHNHLWFRRAAMDVSCAAGRYAEARRHAAALEAFTAAEPLPWSDFHVRRIRALAAVAEGGRDAAHRAELEALRRAALEAGLTPAVPALDAALASFPGTAAS
ncbi:MAG: AAA family ATPase [Alphaproteobacteria bacterium]|nr:AAA family ATPase [Alphaproteobacteria bacterium]